MTIGGVAPNYIIHHGLLIRGLPFLIGKPSISMGHFPWLCEITRGYVYIYIIYIHTYELHRGIMESPNI